MAENWTRDRKSHVQRPNHYTTQPPQIPAVTVSMIALRGPKPCNYTILAWAAPINGIPLEFRCQVKHSMQRDEALISFIVKAELS